jgi:hypothetical protein
VPASIFDAMARNEILQIVVFSVFVGSAVAALDGKAPALLTACEQIAAVMLKITGYVMVLAPLVVFAALASTVATSGLGIVVVYAKFIGGFYFSLGLLWVVLLAASMLAVRRRIGALLQTIREPILLAFSTATSEAAYPYLLSGLPKFGIPRKIVSFVLPLGYSFNLDGSMMYCTFASLFIARLTASTQHRPADHHAGAADDHLQGHCRGAARLAGGDRRDLAGVPPARSGTVADHRRRSPAGHGPQCHQCGGKFGGGVIVSRWEKPASLRIFPCSSGQCVMDTKNRRDACAFFTRHGQLGSLWRKTCPRNCALPTGRRPIPCNPRSKSTARNRSPAGRSRPPAPHGQAHIGKWMAHWRDRLLAERRIADGGSMVLAAI